MTTQATNHTALVIDDSVFSREWLAGILQHMGFKSIDFAESGVAALERVKTAKPDLIFLDAVMPGMDGLTTLKELRKLLPDVIVVITSSSSTKEVVLQFRDAGAHFYLRKPLDPPKVRETVEKAFEMMGSPQVEG
jgi:two-component system chemotaxis response regulator CheY